MDKTAKKGNSTLAFVKRKLYACSEESITFRPHLEYATAVWDPYRQNHLEKLYAV